MSDLLSRMRGIEDADVAGKRVLVRADLNVPMKDGQVTDTTRLDRVVPTIQSLSERGAKVVIITHFGRPGGEKVPELSVAPVAAKLSELIGKPVKFVADCVGPVAAEGVNAMSDGDVAMLENLRFYAGETKNDPDFVKQLAENGDVYVSDAFSTSHRAHASTEGLGHHMPPYAGPLMMAEITALASSLDNPKRPVAAIVGGAKVSTKITVLTNLTKKVDVLIIGGGMANTFLFAQGKPVGKSLCEPDFKDTALEIIAAAEAEGCKIMLPSDVVVADEFKANASNQVVSADAVPEGGMILDAGPQAVNDLEAALEDCQTLIWNGPLGAFEMEPFGKATFALAEKAAELTKAGKLITVGGGGDTVAALNIAGVSDDFTYISTAGGAFLEWMEGKQLPGVMVLAQY